MTSGRSGLRLLWPDDGRFASWCGSRAKARRCLSIQVDVAPLGVSLGDLTASWVKQDYWINVPKHWRAAWWCKAACWSRYWLGQLLSQLSTASVSDTNQPVERVNCLAEAGEIIERTQERYNEGQLHRPRGDLLNTTGDQAAASETIIRPSRSRSGKGRNSGSCAPRPASPASGVIRASAERLAISWRQSTVGSPKASTRRSSKMQGCCSTN